MRGTSQVLALHSAVGLYTRLVYIKCKSGDVLEGTAMSEQAATGEESAWILRRDGDRAPLRVRCLGDVEVSLREATERTHPRDHPASGDIHYLRLELPDWPDTRYPLPDNLPELVASGAASAWSVPAEYVDANVSMSTLRAAGVFARTAALSPSDCVAARFNERGDGLAVVVRADVLAALYPEAWDGGDYLALLPQQHRDLLCWRRKCVVEGSLDAFAAGRSPAVYYDAALAELLRATKPLSHGLDARDADAVFRVCRRLGALPPADLFGTVEMNWTDTGAEDEHSFDGWAPALSREEREAYRIEGHLYRNSSGDAVDDDGGEQYVLHCAYYAGDGALVEDGPRTLVSCKFTARDTEHAQRLAAHLAAHYHVYPPECTAGRSPDLRTTDTLLASIVAVTESTGAHADVSGMATASDLESDGPTP